VMSWRLTRPLVLLAATRAASTERDQPGTTMMAALYRPAGRRGNLPGPAWPVSVTRYSIGDPPVTG
jgi:hypothetical protein